MKHLAPKLGRLAYAYYEYEYILDSIGITFTLLVESLTDPKIKLHCTICFQLTACLSIWSLVF